jgi:hypothetical protein
MAALNTQQQRFNLAMAHAQGLSRRGTHDRGPDVLQAMLEHLRDPGLTTVVDDILDCGGDCEQLRGLADNYITAVFLPWRCLRLLSLTES